MRITARSLDGAIGALRALKKVEAPVQFLDQVRSRLEKPSVFSGLKNRLQTLFAGNHLLKLSGAAATAVLVIAIAQVALRDSGHKDSVPPAPPSVESPPLPGTPPSAEGTAAPAARLQSPPDAGRENGKALDRAVTAPRPAPVQGIEARSVTLTIKLPGVSPKRKSSNGEFEPEKFSASSPRARSGAPASGRVQQRVSRKAAGPGEVSGSNRAAGNQKISSDVIRLIKRSNGKVLSEGPARDENQPGALLAEIPGSNYQTFIDRLRQLGEIEINGDSDFSPAPDAKVRVSVGFTVQ